MTPHPLQMKESLEESLHFYISPAVPHCQSDLKSVYSSADTGPRTDFAFFYSARYGPKREI